MPASRLPTSRLAASAVLALAPILLAAAPAGAQQKPTLTVYTYSSFAGEYGPGPGVKARFEAVCGCTLEWVSTEDAGTLLARLKLEGAGTPADVVLGLDNNLIAEARASGLFVPHGQDATALALPVAWTDETFLPFDWGWFGFVYDSTKLTDPPASFADLVDNPAGPTLIIEDPRTSTPGLGLLTWVQEIYGERAGAVWTALSPRIVTVTKGWSEAYGLFLDGEADMVLSYTTSPAYHIAEENDDRYKAAIFSEGHALQVEVSAVVASSDQPELAKAFLAFTVSDAFQSLIPETNWMYPATAPAGGLPASFAGLPQPAVTLYADPAELADRRRAWIDGWLAAFGR